MGHTSVFWTYHSLRRPCLPYAHPPCRSCLFLPRIVIVGLWLLTTWFVGVFSTLLWPILGFLFAPTTMLWYSVVINVFGGTWDVVSLAGLAVAVVLDLSPAAGRGS